MADRQNEQDRTFSQESLFEAEQSDFKSHSLTPRVKRIKKAVQESPSRGYDGRSGQNSQKGYFIDQSGRRKNITFVLSESNLEINKNRKFSDVLNSVIQKFVYSNFGSRCDQDNCGSDESVGKFEQKHSPSTLCEALSLQNALSEHNTQYRLISA